MGDQVVCVTMATVLAEFIDPWKSSFVPYIEQASHLS